jgi:hypothetical protein
VCGDTIKNGDETAIDCGGSACTPCLDGYACRTAGDCLSGTCGSDGRCAPANRPRAQPLAISDLLGISAMSLPGFNVVGFRCKSLVVCGVNQTCHYSAGRLGSLQSAEERFYDADVIAPGPVRLRVGPGAASQCGNPPFKILRGDFVELVYDGGRRLRVALPAFGGRELSLYVALDGSTYWDRELTSLAARF